MTRVRKSLAELPSIAVFVMALGLLVGVGLLDWATPPEVALTVLYFIPISFATWYGGTVMGFLMAGLSAIATLVANWAVTLRYPNPALHFWNGLISLAVFCVITALANAIARLRRLRDVEESAKQAAEESSRFKSYVVSLVNHEFANAVTLLRGSLGFLKETEPGPVSGKRRRSYETLERVISRLHYATVNFLNLNRLESGNFRPDIRAVSVPPLIEDVLLALSPMTESLDIRLNVEVRPDVPDILADADALRLILANLLHNAFKYTETGGQVTIRVAEKDGAVEFSIQDTGIGISPEDKKRIFTGFYRSSEAKGMAKGFGVGLRITFDILRSLGSELKLQSAPGKGSRFYFRLSVQEEQTAVSA